MKRFCHRFADAGGDAIQRHAKRRAPRWTGELRESIVKGPVVVRPTARGAMGYEVKVEALAPYAAFVEFGTGLWGPRHDYIRPKRPDGWLRWIDRRTGKPIFAKKVKGQPGQHYMSGAVGMFEAEFDRVAAPLLSAWAVEQARSNKTAF